MKKEDLAVSYPVAQLGSALGFAGGVALAFKNSTGFWKGWGYAIIGSIVVGGIGYGVDSLIKYNSDKSIKKANDEHVKEQGVTYGEVTFR